MRSAKEFYERYTSLSGMDGEDFAQVLNEARREVVYECANKAKSEWVRWGEHYGHQVERDSIINLLDELK